MTTPAPADYPDWTTPVTQVAVGRILFNDGPFTLPIASIILDVSEYQSLDVGFSFNNYGAGKPVNVTLAWGSADSPSTTDSFTVFEFNSNNTGVAAVRDIITPVKGTQVQIDMTGTGDAVEVEITITGSTIPVPGQYIQVGDDFAADIPLSITGAPINAGQTLNYYFGPVNNKILFTSDPSAAKVVFSVSFWTCNNSGFQNRIIYAYTSTGGITEHQELNPPRQGMMVAVTNTDTVAHSFSLYVSNEVS